MPKLGLVLSVAAVAILGGLWAYLRTVPVGSRLSVVSTAPPAPAASKEESPQPPESVAPAEGRAERRPPAARRVALATVPAPMPLPQPLRPLVHGAPLVARISAPLSTPPASAEPPALAQVFDAAAPDVAPPTLLTPIANAPVRTDAQYVPGSATIEVVVNANGSVSSVRAATQPATIAEALQMVNWLSITKSWRFNPARRDGRPVRYRLLIPLSRLVAGRGAR